MALITAIFCEGKTEKAYFEILRNRVFRIPGYVRICIEGERGQHFALVDRLVRFRADLAISEGVDESDIACWAVCDDDGMETSFAALSAYAAERRVSLAFSRPQFESYLLQHFEPSKETGKRELVEALESRMVEAGFAGRYDKADLSWLAEILIDRPKMVDIAIRNADLRDKQSSSPFFTVQELTKYLRSLRRE